MAASTLPNDAAGWDVFQLAGFRSRAARVIARTYSHDEPAERSIDRANPDFVDVMAECGQQTHRFFGIVLAVEYACVYHASSYQPAGMNKPESLL